MRRDEHRLQNALLVALSEIDGCLAWRHVVGVFRAYSDPETIVKVGEPGQADVFCVYRGHAFSIELKSKTGRLKKPQEKWAESFKAAGGTAVIVRSTGGDKQAIRSAVRETALLVKTKGAGSAEPTPDHEPTDRNS